MEHWQIKHIKENFTQLVKSTFVSETLKAILVSKALLSSEEVQDLRADRTSISQAIKLYEILTTRRNGYKGLLEALNDTRQTGAYNILQSGLENHAIRPEDLFRIYKLPIHFHNTVLPLQEVFPSFNEEDAKELIGTEGVRTELNEFVTDDTKVLRLDREIPTVNTLYVPRFILNRLTLDPLIFKLKCRDVFVFKGIAKYELVELLMPHVTRSSSSQLTTITCRHIFLEDNEDWDEITLLSTEPTHLVAKQGACFYVERSTEVTDVIRDNIIHGRQSEDAFISENRFAKMLLSETDFSSNTFILSDTAGMGKTWFMQNLALKVNQISHNVCSIYFQLPTLSKMVQYITNDLERNQNLLEVFLGLVYRSKLVAHLLTKHVLKNGMKLFLFLDEFDAVLSTETNALLKFFECFQGIKNLRVMISTRISTRGRVEKVLKNVSYEFLPLRRQEQVDLIVQHWKNNVPNSDSDNLKIFADKRIESFANSYSDILGTPTKCRMFAVIHEDKVRQFSALNSWSQQDFEANYSIAQVYKMYVDVSINKLEGDDIRNKLISYHTRKAVSTLLPESVKADQLQEINTVEDQQATLIEKVGFLGHTYASSGSAFTDRGVAEFIIAQLVVDFLSGVESPYNCVPVGDSNLCQTLFQTFSNGNGIRAIDGVCLDGFLVKVKISSFHHSTILDYINQLFIHDTYSVEVYSDSLLNFLQENLFTVVIASIEENFVNLLYLVQSLLKQTSSHHLLHSLVVPKDLFVKPEMCLSSTYDNWIEINRKIASAAYVLYRIATKGTSQVAEAVFELFSSGNYNFFQEISDQFPADWPSPIDVAIYTNNLDVIKYLVGKISLDGRTLRSCLTGTNMSEPEMKIRKIACDELINQNSRIVTEFYKSIGEDMHTFEYNINILSHVCLKYELNLKNLSIKAKQRILDAALLCYNDAQFLTLLLLLFANLDTIRTFIESNRNMTVFHKCITSKSQEFDMDGARKALNEVKCEKYDYLFEIKDVETLQLLVKIYGNFSSTNSYQRNLLHISVTECKLDWIKVLLRDEKFNINQKDKEGNTPLLCINAWNPIEITKLLIDNGAKIDAVNNKLQNVAHILMQHYADPDSTFIAWTKMLLEMGHEKLWHQQDDMQNTPVDNMDKKWGHKNPFPLISHLIQMKTWPSRLGQGYINKFKGLLQILVPKV